MCKTKITWSSLNPYVFSDIKENPCGWAMNLGDKFQNFQTFIIALLIDDDEGWITFDSSHQLDHMRRRWTVKLIAGMENKL